jgi:hypothetical protein
MMALDVQWWYCVGVMMMLDKNVTLMQCADSRPSSSFAAKVNSAFTH